MCDVHALSSQTNTVIAKVIVGPLKKELLSWEVIYIW